MRAPGKWSNPRSLWQKRLIVVASAVGIQGMILGLALLIGVLDPKSPKEARLKVPPGSVRANQAAQHKMEQTMAQIRRMQQEGLSQVLDEFLESTGPRMEVPRPDTQTTMMAMGAMLPVDTFFQDQSHALSAMGSESALPLPEPVTFMGESLSATRIVLLLDVSGSVKTKIERAGLSMEKLREEVYKFVDQLGPNHLFGIIQFTRKWQSFRDELLPATQSVKEEARAWIGSSFRTTGTSGSNWNGGYPNGIEAVLSAVYEMDAGIDQIFLVSDGDFQRTPPGGGGQDVPWGELRRLSNNLQKSSIAQTRLRLLCFYPPEDTIPELRAWARENGDGSLRIIE